MRTGAPRASLPLSATSMAPRACDRIARETRTSPASKSSRSPSASRAEAPITAMSTLNWRIESTAMSPVSPPSARRSLPPVRITSAVGWAPMICATLRLLVTTIRFGVSMSARATASVVVPMLRNSDAPAGMSAAAVRAIASFAGADRRRRSS